MTPRRMLLCVVAALALSSAGLADPTPGRVTAKDTNAQEDDRAVTPEREAAAVTFAQRHHPELAKLLGSLKKADKEKYESAIRELFRTSERLAKLQSRTPERYDLELAVWKLDSRIKLLTARSVSGMPDAMRAELKQLVQERQKLKLTILEADRDKVAARLKTLESEIDTLQDSGEALAEKEVERLLKSVKTKPVVKPVSPASESASEKAPGKKAPAKTSADSEPVSTRKK